MPKPKASVPSKSGASPGEPAGKALKLIRTEDLLFDSKNPRYPKTLLGADEAGVIKWMLDNANIIELMNSIGEQGYFSAEPLVVVPSSLHPGKFEVIEGNRRLTAVKLLRNPGLASVKKKSVSTVAGAAKQKPSELPCLVYERQGDVLHFLAFRHVTGILAWDPLQKARYLKRFAGTDEIKGLDRPELRRRLAKAIGSTPNYVARLLAGLAVFEAIEDADFFGIPNLDAEGDRYTVLTTAVTSYSNIAKFLGLETATDSELSKVNMDHLKKLARWLFERSPGGKARVPESRDLQKLSRVIGKKEALARFEDGLPLKNANLLAGEPLAEFRQSISQAKFYLEAARDAMEQGDDHERPVNVVLSEIQAMLSGLVKRSRLSKGVIIASHPITDPV